ncbi:MAG: hypothetical protein ACLVAK_07720 [Clostridia bacterium]
MKKPNGFEESKGNFQEPKKPDKEDDKEDDKDIDKKKCKRKTFTPPSLKEIEEYIIEKQLKVNAKDFFDFFTEGKWVDSNGKRVLSWKQKLLTWNSHEQKQKNKSSGEKKSGFSNYEQRQYDDNDLNNLIANR